MKKIKKIGSLATLFLIMFYNSCFADLVLPGEEKRPAPVTDGREKLIKFIIAGVVILGIVICAVLVIRKTNKKNKEIDSNN